MAGNNKPRKKFDPKKHKRKVLNATVMLNHTLSSESRYQLNAPIDLSIHRLGAGGGCFIDWANVWFRTQICYQLAFNRYDPEIAAQVKELFDSLEGIKQRNIDAHPNVHGEDWSFTSAEYADFLNIHDVTNQMQEELHVDIFLPVFKHVDARCRKVIDEFMTKYPASFDQAKEALTHNAIPA